MVDVNLTEVIDAYVEIDIYSQQLPDGARNMGKNDVWIAACAKPRVPRCSRRTRISTISKYIDPTSTLPSSSGT